MRDLLAREQGPVLDRFLAEPALIAFDFDGTLAPIVDDHRLAAMRPETARLLAELGRRRPVAVVSGRAKADVVKRLEGAAVVAVIGNHGLEGVDEHDLRRLAIDLAPVREALAPLPEIEGVEVEDKGMSLAVHYRRAPDHRAARRAIDRVLGLVIARLPGMRIVPGKLLVNVLPAGGADKGEAIEKLMRDVGLDRVLFVGDDLTDESVFRRGAGREGWLAVRVGRSRRSAAPWYVRDQRAVDRLLARLL